MEYQQTASTDISMEKAKGFQEQERFDEAVEIYNELMKQKSDNQEVYYNKAVCLETQGKFQEALLSIKEVLQLDASHPLAFGNAGRIYIKMNKTMFAKPSFERQLKVCPTSLPSILYLSKLQLEEDSTGREFIESTKDIKSWLKDLPSDQRNVQVKDFTITLNDLEMEILKKIKEMLHLFSELTNNPNINQDATMKKFYEISSEITALKINKSEENVLE